MIPGEKAIFEAALSIEGENERESFLGEACSQSPELLRRLRELLSAHEHSQGPLDRRSAMLLATLAPERTEGPGTLIGPYKLLQQIGEGGMGTVYMAEQTQPVQRKVALKVIKPGMDSRQVVARFEAERQALAVMDHVNIARVFDGGATESGRPYFVMELVHGIPITRYCDENRLSPRDRIELFLPVCQAIQHAHQKGIIHRDIKPSNVMVTHYDGKPVPKVIDFGVAKATDRKLTEGTLFTQFGAMVGTPEYMSPEQAELSALGVDTRSDIYSLGVLLYELLSGSTPLTHNRLKGAAFVEILRLIKEEDPPKPSTRIGSSGDALASISANRQMEPAKLRKRVRGELDWIVMKCLEKDRNRRYETANGFAQDLQRYLTDEPVTACPPSPGYRLWKFTRRHRRSLAAAAAFLLLLFTAVVALSFALVAVNHERQQKEEALRIEAKRRKQTRSALDSMSSLVIEDWPGKQPELLQIHKEFLEHALRDYEEFAADTGQEEESRAGAANAYRRVGAIQDRLGQDKDAEIAWKTSSELYAQLAKDFPGDPSYSRMQGLILQHLSKLILTEGRLKEGEQYCAASIELFRNLLKSHPDYIEAQWGLAQGVENLAAHWNETGRTKEANSAIGEAISICRDLASTDSSNSEYEQLLGRALWVQGVSQRNLGKTKEAETSFREAAEIYRKWHELHPTNPEFAYRYSQSGISLGLLLHQLKRFVEAEPVYQSSLDTSKKLHRDFPSVPAYSEAVARVLNNLGDFYREGDRIAEAEAAFRESIELRKAMIARFPTQAYHREGLAMSLNNLGILLKDHDRAAEGEALYREALTIHEKLAADYPTVSNYQNNVAGALGNIARLLLARGEAAAAKEMLETGQKHCLAALKTAPNHPAYRRFYRINRWRMAEALLALKDHEGAAGAIATFLEYATEPPRDAYTAATLYAGCVALAKLDNAIDEPKREELVANYSEMAIASLRDAIAKSAKETEKMNEDPTLEPIRTRAEFQELLRASSTESVKTPRS